MRRVHVLAVLIFAANPPLAASPPLLELEALLASTTGQWRGELQYRDYQSNSWEGLPMEVRIATQPDRVTQIRTASFDDGPKVGFVYITTIMQLDPATGQQSYAQFRKGRAADTGTVQLRRLNARDSEYWSIVATETRRDGDSQAEVRETTTREGDRMVTLKEVNPQDDGKDEWLPRNRTILTFVRS